MSSSGELDLEFAHSVSEVEPEAWDGLSGGRAFASHRWYQYGEAVLPGDLPVYLIGLRRGVPVARATFWLTRDIPLPGLSRWQRVVLRAVLARRPVLLCRTPLADVPGLILPNDPAAQTAALAQISRTACDWGRQHAVSFVVFDYLTAEAAAPAGLPAGLASTVVQDPGTRLCLGWPDFAGYLAGLHKKTRQSYKSNRERAARLGLEVWRHPQVPDVAEALRLVGNVEQRFGSPAPWARLALEHMPKVGGRWLAAEREGKPAAACLYLQDGPGAMLTLLGRDYNVPFAYFQMFYEGIACAIEAGVRELRGGSGAYELKYRFGFQPEANNHVAYAAASPWLGRLGRWAAAG